MPRGIPKKKKVKAIEEAPVEVSLQAHPEIKAPFSTGLVSVMEKLKKAGLEPSEIIGDPFAFVYSQKDSARIAEILNEEGLQ